MTTSSSLPKAIKATKDTPRQHQWRGIFTDMLKRLSSVRLSGIIVTMAIIFGIATYAALSEAPLLSNDPETIFWLLNIDFIIFLALGILIARRTVALISGRKRGIAGSHLQVRLVYTFSLLAAVPAIIMTVFSLFFFHYGVQTWFSSRVQTAVENSFAVAKAYVDEHKEVIKSDTMAMAADLDRQAAFIFDDLEAFEHMVDTQARLRSLSEAIVFDSLGRSFARSALSFSLEFEEIPDYAMESARNGEVVVMKGSNDDRVRALVKLRNYVDTYLYVGRMVDPEVLSYLVETQEAAQDYDALKGRYSDLQILVMLIFVVIGLILLMLAIWFGLILARQLVEPIITLIQTTDQVRAGDLSVRVPERTKLEEFDYLAQAFNRMTRQIQQQRTDLLEANRQVDRRRKLTESVLKGVSSGVIGVDKAGAINLANASANALLGYNDEDLSGRDVHDILPEAEELLTVAHTRPNKTTQGELGIMRADGNKRLFFVRVVIEQIEEDDIGAIITFDDITELQAAQKNAAWSDVARRIAHEIKNPLTPIQLSAERLQRKYQEDIKQDPETFKLCTDTIIKHVSDIGRMVDEFSAFARMPEPKMRKASLLQAVNDAVFLQRQAHAQVTFSTRHMGDKADYKAYFDGQQVRQAVNNLLQNAIDSAQEHSDNPKIQVYLSHDDNAQQFVVIVSDNGVGLPQGEDLLRLTEPYITHKPKGTGLGLAIVRKIMEDHQGLLKMGVPDWVANDPGWESLGGANISLIFPNEKEDRA